MKDNLAARAGRRSAAVGVDSIIRGVLLPATMTRLQAEVA